jgi:LDH2 family malate/lactate/ureidoglycolate dehydrogenase
MRRVAAGPLEDWSRRTLEAAGLEAEGAATVAQTLIDASLRGVDSHGIARTVVYAERLRAGTLNPRPRPRVERRDGALALLDGDRGPGQIAALAALDLTVELAREHGVGAVAVRRSSHFGAAGWYTVRAARQGLVALATCNSDPLVVPFGGSRPALGTNPIAIAAPTPDGVWTLDMATSQVAWNKIVNARIEGRTLPEGWAVDPQGLPTTDAEVAIGGLPLGGYKGYGLAVMVEVLSAVFSGAGVQADSGRLFVTDEPQDVGHFFLALDPERTVGRDAFAATLAGLLTALRANPPAAGFDEVLVPGDPEDRAARERTEMGVPLPDGLWAQMEVLSGQLGVELAPLVEEEASG